LIPAGTGLAYHENRRQRFMLSEVKNEGDLITSIDIDDVEEALKQALNI
jgi:DNA-directed RNA polymerase subunit beta'